MRSILFVGRADIYYYGGNIHAPLSFQLPHTIYQDMEIIDIEQFTQFVNTFIQKNKIQSCSMIIFFSSKTCFIKDFQTNLSPQEEEVQKNVFIENIPFDKVVSRLYKLKKDANTLVAVNSELILTLKDIFTKLNFIIEGLIPSFVLFGDQEREFNIDTAQHIVKHFSSLPKMGFSLIKQESIALKEEQEEFNFEKPQETKTRLYVMVGLFAMLMLVLFYMLFTLAKKPKNKPIIIQPSPPVSIIVQKLTPTTPQIPSPIENTAPKNQISIQILNGSGVPGQANALKEKLNEAGYTTISTGNAQTQESATTLVVIKPTVQIYHRNEIDNIVRSLGFKSALNQNSEIDVDVLITIRKEASQE